MSIGDDYTEIVNLVARYCHLVDANDYEGLGDLFAHAELTPGRGGTYRGRDEIIGFYRGVRHADVLGHALAGQPRPASRHVAANPLVDVAADGTTATSCSYYLTFGDPDETGRVQLGPSIGRYVDEFTKIDGTWCFTRRQVFRDIGHSAAAR